MRIKGIDISRAQEKFDFTAAQAAGNEFVIIRAGIGKDEDSYFRQNIIECAKRGLAYGCYWYITAVDNAELDSQIKACIKVLDNEKPSNPSWLESYYQKERLVGKYDIWLAHWTESPDYPSRFDYGQKMWQWGVDNIGGKDVDGDICFVDYPAITARWYEEHCIEKPPEKPDDEKHNGFSKGDKVRVKRDAVFTNGVKPYSYVYDTVYTVLQVSGNGKETLIGLDGVPTGWLYTADLYKAEDDTQTQKFVVGDKVKVNYGAKTYNGGSLALFVYTNVYEVMQAGSGDREDYIVIGQGREITAAVRAEDLKKI